jgi:hypothetical protein
LENNQAKMARTTNRLGKSKQSSDLSPKASLLSNPVPVSKKNEILNWPSAILLAIVAFAVSFKVTLLMRSIINPAGDEIHHNIKEVQIEKTAPTTPFIPQVCGATDYIAEVEVPGLHLVVYNVILHTVVTS